MAPTKHTIYMGAMSNRRPSVVEVAKWGDEQGIDVDIGGLYGNYFFNTAEDATMFKLTFGGIYYAPLQEG